jgi:hypothetical protein
MTTPVSINFVDFVTPVPAIWLNYVNSFVNTTIPTQSVTSIAGLRTVSSVNVQYVFVAGYYAPGDGGGGWYSFISTDHTSTDNGGSIIVASDGGRWYLQNSGRLSAKQFGAYADATHDDSTALQYIWSTGLHGYNMPAGQYKFNTAILNNYNTSSPSFPIPGVPSARADIAGDSLSNTILVYGGTGYAIVCQGSDNGGISQGLLGLDVYRGFTLQNTTFSPAASSGITFVNKAWWKLEDVYIQYMGVALQLESCFTSKVLKCIFGYSNIGVDMTATSLGACNAISFDSCTFQNNTQMGVLGTNVGANNIFRDCTFESNGTQGNLSTGGFVGNVSAFGSAGPILFENCYFEENAGIADISIDNPTSSPLTILIRGCSFTRASNVFYTNNNISVTSSGGGQVKVLLEGNQFISAAPYVASNTRPFWNAGSSVVQFVDNGGNSWTETTSLPQPFYSGRAVAMVNFVGSTGVPTVSENLTVARAGVGGYNFTFVNPLLSANYGVQVTGDAGGNGAVGYHISGQATTGFSLTVTNQTNVQFDPTTVAVTVYN